MNRIKNISLIMTIILLAFYADLFSAGKTDKGRQLVFKSDFKNNPQLKGWRDVYKYSPKNHGVEQPKAEWYQVVTEDGETFLKTRKDVMFGISSLFKKPLEINDSIDEIELSVTFRKPGQAGRPAGIALISRTCPSGRNGGPFWIGHKDSGILAQGYPLNIQHLNIIAWQKDGRQVMMSPCVPPFNLLTKMDEDEWVTWRLVYKHQKKELSFFRDSNETEPFITQHNVDLTGTVLRSVWIGAWGAEYLNIEVYKKTTS